MTVLLMSDSSPGYAPSVPGEWAYVLKRRSAKPPLLYFHGSGDDSFTVPAKAGQKALIRRLAQSFTVIVPDLAFQAWGNNSHVARANDAYDWCGAIGPIPLVAGSMGMLGALGMLLNNPDRVSCVAGIIPALDILDLMGRGAAASINAAYGGTYIDSIDGPTHSPVRYATTMPQDVPVRLWTASDDTICVPPTAYNFCALRPATSRVDLGALGHSETATLAAVERVYDWVLDNA